MEHGRESDGQEEKIMNVQLSRRLFLAGATVSAGASALPRKVFAQAAAPAAPTGPFALPQLGYAFNALEPHIDAMTMEILLAEWQQLPEAIRMVAKNSLGGHANHTMFWQVMTPGGAKAPEGELKAAIDRDLGGFDKLKADFNGTGGRLFGSGWVFVTVSKDGRLAIVSKPNQDTPLMDGQMVLFGNDVWEHAYYLKYQNRRPEYLANWWNVANWSRIGERYAAAKAGTLEI